MTNSTFIGDTPRDSLTTNLKGPAGLITISPPDERPSYTKLPVRVEWPIRRDNNGYPIEERGAVMEAYSGSDPEGIKGAGCSHVYIDELSKMRYQDKVIHEARMIMRESENAQCIIVTTPRSTPTLIKLAEDPHVLVINGSLHENHDLPRDYVQDTYNELHGTRYGLEELHGKILKDIDGSLFKLEWFQYIDQGDVELGDLSEIVVAVDPSGAYEKDRKRDATKQPNEVGIAVVGRVRGSKQCIVLECISGVWGPEEWSKKVEELYYKWEAGLVVLELNYGRSLAESVISRRNKALPVEGVNASKSKELRATPVSLKYQRGEIYHLREGMKWSIGDMRALEIQLTQMTTKGYIGEKSPDKVDAVVWGILKVSGLIGKKQRKFRFR